ncbi:MAG: glycine cleavage system protein R [Verrucomicrobiaceae bacterium]
MKSSFVITLVGPDRSGLVDSVADVIARHGGSWQESRMARLAGQFAGILHIDCPVTSAPALEADLAALDNLHLILVPLGDSDLPTGQVVKLEIVGHDQPGIIKRIASTIASHQGNVEELETFLESAPMAGHLLFRTCGTIRLADGQDSSLLVLALEELGPDLTVDIL